MSQVFYWALLHLKGIRKVKHGRKKPTCPKDKIILANLLVPAKSKDSVFIKV